MRSPMLALLLTAALLSGCLVEAPDAETITPAPQESSSASDPVAEEVPVQPASAPEAAAGPHGTPQRTDGAVTSGVDSQRVPGAWARQAITISNDFGGATLGDLQAKVAAGSIVVRAADREGYLVEAALEARAGTEADARALLERTHVEHTDVLDGSTLFLTDGVRVDQAAPAAPGPLPPGILQVGTPQESVSVSFVITVPLSPAIDLVASAASGDVSASDLHGPRLDMDTSSGDITLTTLTMTEVVLSSASGDIVADTILADALTADTSSGDIQGDDLVLRHATLSSASGDIGIAGTVDNIDADTSSGDLVLDVAAAASGDYRLDSASGDVVVRVPAEGQAYHVDAGTASGTIRVDVPDAETLEDKERHVEVASEGYDDAAIQTAIEAGTSSGDITVQAD